MWTFSLRSLLQIRARYIDHMADWRATRLTHKYTQIWNAIWNKFSKHTISIKSKFFCCSRFSGKSHDKHTWALFDGMIYGGSCKKQVAFMGMKTSSESNICTWRRRALHRTSKMEMLTIDGGKVELGKVFFIVLFPRRSFALCVRVLRTEKRGN